jgi:hypothetical protein
MFNNLQKPSDSVQRRQREIQRERKNQDDEFIVQLLENTSNVNVSMKTTQNRILKIKVRFRRPYLAASI